MFEQATAIQIRRHNRAAVNDFVNGTAVFCGREVLIPIGNSILKARRTNWLVRDVYGNLFVCPSKVFKNTYALANPINS
jgi:hypothetical protein